MAQGHSGINLTQAGFLSGETPQLLIVLSFCQLFWAFWQRTQRMNVCQEAPKKEDHTKLN